VLIGADLVYEPTLAAPLAATLATLLSAQPSRGRRRALIASVRRTETWELFVREVAARGLVARDRTAEAHAAMAAADGAVTDAGGPFWLAAEEVERVHLLEITTETQLEHSSQ